MNEYLKLIGGIVRAQTPEEAGKVYAEMEEAIRSRQIGEISTSGDTSAESRWIVERNPMSDTIAFRCSYSVNGNRQLFTVEKDIALLHHININDLLFEVFEEFAKAFAKIFAADLLNCAANSFRPEINSRLTSLSSL